MIRGNKKKVRRERLGGRVRPLPSVFFFSVLRVLLGLNRERDLAWCDERGRIRGGARQASWPSSFPSWPAAKGDRESSNDCGGATELAISGNGVKQIEEAPATVALCFCDETELFWKESDRERSPRFFFLGLLERLIRREEQGELRNPPSSSPERGPGGRSILKGEPWTTGDWERETTRAEEGK